MLECDCCHEKFESLENWGSVKLCPSCVIYYEKGLPKNATKKEMQIKIEKPQRVGGANYNPWTSELQFVQKDTPALLTWEEIINHEFMHFILHRDVDIKCCYQYDSVHKAVDPFHTYI